MLLSFKLENVFPFFKPLELSMEAGKIKHLDNYQVVSKICLKDDIEPIKILKIALIFGANNSGKSSLIKYLYNYIKFLYKKDITLIENELFLKSLNSNSLFELEFIYKNELFKISTVFKNNNFKTKFFTKTKYKNKYLEIESLNVECIKYLYDTLFVSKKSISYKLINPQHVFKNKKIFLVDDEYNWHPKIFENFIINFLTKHKESNNQLIVTTHHSEFLINELLYRRDSIWFLNNNSDKHFPVLHSLYDLKNLKENDNVYNFYKQGRLGGYPILE